MMIVHGLVVSRVRYCASVYGGGSAANDTRLLRVINFATRVVTGLRKYDHVSDARHDLHLLSPRQLSDLQLVTIAHKALVLGEPGELAGLLCTNADARASTRSTRQDSRLRPPSMRTAAGQRSFAYRAAGLVNSLPVDVRELGPRDFKRAVKSVFRSE